MSKFKYPLALETITKADKLKLSNFIKTNSKLTQGQYVEKMEKTFAKFHKMKYCTMVNSGSSANLVMIASLVYHKDKLLKKNDEVIVPVLGWSTSYSPLFQFGLVPVFVDIDHRTFNIDIKKIEKSITSKTKAILVINILGNPSEYSELKKIAKKYSLILIEDNCESLGAEYKGKLCGTFGIMSTCSSFFSHHISTIEGGYILTNSEYIDAMNKSIRSHGWLRDPSSKKIYKKKVPEFKRNFTFINPGFNVRSTEINAFLGLLQMKRLKTYLQIRRKNHVFFNNIISRTNNFSIQQECHKSSWFGFGITYSKKDKKKFKKIINFLKNKFEIRPIVSGDFTKQPMIYNNDFKFKISNLKNIDIIDEFGFMIGNNPHLLSKEAKKIIQKTFLYLDSL